MRGVEGINTLHQKLAVGLLNSGISKNSPETPDSKISC
jgi:hypothetical protein